MKKAEADVTVAKRDKKKLKTTPPTTTEKPEVPQYCSEIQASLKLFNVEGLIKILNKEYNKIGSPPNTHEACYDTLDKMLFTCSINPLMYDQDVLKKNSSNLVIKIRFKETSCKALNHIISKFLNDENFGKLRPSNEKVILLALAFSENANSVISEWITLFYEGGKITSAQQNAARCLWDKAFADLKYKTKPIADYFPKISPE